jgi:ABC-2 type transport system ATP-binding protein
LAGGGTTVILTTHYLDEAEHLADRVGVIAAGQIVAIDAPQRLGGRADSDATVGWSEDGERRTIVTAEPTRIVKELAARFDAEIPGLEITRPTLEDVYLRLIGAAGPTNGAAQT